MQVVVQVASGVDLAVRLFELASLMMRRLAVVRVSLVMSFGSDQVRVGCPIGWFVSPHG